jgi:hypothetical protein
MWDDPLRSPDRVCIISLLAIFAVIRVDSNRLATPLWRDLVQEMTGNSRSRLVHAFGTFA